MPARSLRLADRVAALLGPAPRRREPRPPLSCPDELYRVPTEDGAAIALGRYAPRGERRPAPPVLLCHGLGANRFGLDLDERYSLARFLARHGWESWVVELRGRGHAGPPLDTTFDEEAEHDVGAALRAVLSTGAREVLWVGHSMGGLLLLAHLARFPRAPVRAGVLLGPPLAFRLPPPLASLLAPSLEGVLASLLARHLFPLRALAPLVTRGGVGLSSLLCGEGSVEEGVWRRALAAMAADVPGGVARQLADWVRHDRFTSADGALDYRRALAEVRTPLLLVAGAADALAPPAAVARGAALLGGPVEVCTAGRAGGFGADYGHLDLVLGRHAPEELYPRVEAFLATHAAPR